MATSAGVAAEKVNIGAPNWTGAQAIANLIQVVVTDKIGGEANLVPGTNATIFQGMNQGKGDIDVHPDVWLPNQENFTKEYVDGKGSVVLSQNPYQGKQNFCVSRAFSEANNVTSIFDLARPEVAALMDGDGNGKGEIWIGAPGWASTNVEKIRAKSYGYDATLDLTEIDETVAYASLANAIEAGDPWVGFCYAPHYLFALHDVVILEEPAHDPAKWTVIQPTDDPDWLAKSDAAVAWDSAYLHVHFAKELETTHPEVAAMLANMALTADEISAMTFALVIDEQEPLAYAEAWVASNEDKVLGWLSN